MFTDQPNSFSDLARTTVCPIPHLPWPLITLLQYQFFAQYGDLLSAMDVLLYCDADMRFVAECGDGMLPDTPAGLVGVRHPGFHASERSAYTYETRSGSTAYVAPSEGEVYYCGGIKGGTASAFLAMADKLAANVNQDLRNNHIALWHDESHLNRYFVDHPPKTLSPSYCYPERWQLPFKKIVLALDKNHGEIRG